jgi:hypothetical protein
MSIYPDKNNVNLFVTDAAQISLTANEMETSYEKLKERLRLYQTLKNTKNPAFHFTAAWALPALAALFAAVFIIPAMQTQRKSPIIAPIETMRYTNSLGNSGVIVDGNITNSHLSSLLADIRGISPQDKTYTGEALPYLPEIDVFKPHFPDHGIHLLNFSSTLINTVPYETYTQMIPIELQLSAVAGSDW